tara:strand:- start:254 stop:595 length:342 start_codon:yes stop_codon:yes gene_type:complete
MTHNITPAQGIIEGRNIQAAMWANRIMTKKISNSTCKYEIAQSTTSDLIEDMEQRVRRYLKAGLVTADTYAPKLDNKLAKLREAARNKPIEHKTTVGGSKDGLWSKSGLGDKK